MKKILCAFLLVLVAVGLFGCVVLTDEEYEADRKGQLSYTYETVDATIESIDLRHWFAGTHRYEWSIEVYYEPYDLEFSENSWANGAFGCPSFFYKSKGDFISVEVRNKYIDGELIERKITRII